MNQLGLNRGLKKYGFRLINLLLLLIIITVITTTTSIAKGKLGTFNYNIINYK